MRLSIYKLGNAKIDMVEDPSYTNDKSRLAGRHRVQRAKGTAQRPALGHRDTFRNVTEAKAAQLIVEPWGRVLQ